MKDLFECLEEQPQKVQNLFSDIEELSYIECENLLKETEKLGYTFDYGLDSQPHSLRKIEIENFTNGFVSWTETYFMIVEFIVLERTKFVDDVMNKNNYFTDEIKQIYASQGTTGLWELAVNWTNEFEKTYENEDWEERDFYETVDAFCETKNTL